MILVAQDVRQHGPLAALGIRDQTHGDARHGLAQFHAGVHEGQRTGANGGHRRRTVRFQNVRHDAHGVGILLAQRNHRFEGAPCQVAVADLTTAQTAGGLRLARREGREIIVEHELLGTLHEHLVLDLLVHLRAERNGGQRLRLASCEEARTVGCGQVVGLAPDRTDLVRATAVETLALVENHVAHRLLLHVVVEIAVDERGLLHQLLLRVAGGELGLQCIEHILALVLHRAARGDGVGLVVEFGDDRLFELLVVDLVAVGTLHVLAQLLRKFDLYGAVLLDLLVRELDRSEHHLLRNLFHLALDHQDVVDRTADHDVQVDVGHLREGRVDAVLAVDARHAHLRNRAAEGDVRHGQCGRGGQTGQRVGLDVLVGRDEVDRHVDLGVVVRREERAQRTVDQTRYEHLAVVGLALTLHETARIAAACGVFLLVFHLQRHEVRVGFCIFGGHDRRKEHRIALFHDNRAVGLLGQFAGLDHDLASVGERDELLNGVVQLLFFHNVK